VFVDHKTEARIVRQQCALSAKGLSEERHRRIVNGKGRRMELDEFQIGHPRTGANRHRETVSCGFARIRCVTPQTSDTSGGEHHFGGNVENLAPFAIDRENANHSTTIEDQIKGKNTLVDDDVGGIADGGS
jgi:hypothetical protein